MPVAFGYVRVSGLAQVRDGEGLSMQRSRIEGWCTYQQLPVATIESDEGISGASMDNRLGLRRVLRAVLKAAERDEHPVLVTYKLDRLGRNALDVQEVLATLLDAGVRVVALGDGIDSASGLGGSLLKLLTSILATFAELEKETIRGRLLAGRQHAKAKARLYACEPPYGQQRESPQTRELVPDGLEQAALERARALRAEGHSYRQICAMLTSEGHRPRRAASWHPAVVQRMVVGRPARMAKAHGERIARVRTELLGVA